MFDKAANEFNVMTSEITRKKSSFGVSLLQHAVIYETLSYFALCVFQEFGLAISACRETSFSYITACR